MPTTKDMKKVGNKFATFLFVGAMIFTSCLFFDQKFTIYFWLFSLHRPIKIILSFLLPFLTGALCYKKNKSTILLADSCSVVMILCALLYGLDVFILHWSWAETDFLSTFSIIYKLETFFSVLLLIVIITLIDKKKGDKKIYFSASYHSFMWGFTPLLVIMFIVVFFIARAYNNTREINLIPLNGELNYIINKSASIYILRDLGNVGFFSLMSLVLLEINNKHKLFFGIAFPIIISILMEALQYILGSGYSDIDDVITNSLGAILGFLINKFVIEKLKEC